MNRLRNRVPPVLVAALCGLLMWFGTVAEEFSLTLWQLLLASVLLLLAGAICLAAVLGFRRARTTVNPLAPQQASSLVESGIYRYSRNPMYLGFVIALLALAVVMGSLYALLGVVAFAVYIHYLQILPEEQALQQRFGTSFRSYKQRVGRWV